MFWLVPHATKSFISKKYDHLSHFSDIYRNIRKRFAPNLYILLDSALGHRNLTVKVYLRYMLNEATNEMKIERGSALGLIANICDTGMINWRIMNADQF